MRAKMIFIYIACTFLRLAHAFTLPDPTGPFNVGLRPYVLNHITPNDPVAPNGTGASILLNFFYPTLQDPKTQKYVPHGLADQYELYFALPSGSFYNITAKYSRDAPFLKEFKLCELPTLLFGPAAAGPPSQMLHALLSDLASYGYIIVTVDHPYEQPYLEYPDGTGFPGPLPNVTDLDPFAVHKYRLTDTSAVLDALPDIANKWDMPLNLTHYVFFGHSVGGSAALSSAIIERNRSDTTVLGALNIDGSIFGGPAAENSSAADVHAPSLILASTGHLWDDEPDYPQFLSLQSDWAKNIMFQGNVNHSDFSDTVLWKQWLGLAGGGNGTSSAARVVQETRKFVGDFMRFVGGGGEGVLSGTEEVGREWPEAVWLYNSTGP